MNDGSRPVHSQEIGLPTGMMIFEIFVMQQSNVGPSLKLTGKPLKTDPWKFGDSY